MSLKTQDEFISMFKKEYYRFIHYKLKWFDLSMVGKTKRIDEVLNKYPLIENLIIPMNDTISQCQFKWVKRVKVVSDMGIENVVSNISIEHVVFFLENNKQLEYFKSHLEVKVYYNVRIQQLIPLMKRVKTFQLHWLYRELLEERTFEPDAIEEQFINEYEKFDPQIEMSNNQRESHKDSKYEIVDLYGCGPSTIQKMPDNTKKIIFHTINQSLHEINITRFTRLESIDVDNCYWEFIFLDVFKDLKELKLNYVNGKMIMENLKKLKNLKKLVVKYLHNDHYECIVGLKVDQILLLSPLRLAIYKLMLYSDFVKTETGIFRYDAPRYKVPDFKSFEFYNLRINYFYC